MALPEVDKEPRNKIPGSSKWEVAELFRFFLSLQVMEKFNEYVLPVLEGQQIRYNSDGVGQSMSVDYFKSSFKNVAVIELPNIGHCYLFYQHVANPEYVMRFRISQNAGISASLITYSDFEKQLQIMQSI